LFEDSYHTLSILEGTSSFDLILDGLEEYFLKKSPQSSFTKYEILVFLHETFIFCDFDLTLPLDNRIDRSLLMLLDIYTMRKKVKFYITEEKITIKKE